MIEFIMSSKFYLPMIYIAVGIIIFKVISEVITRMSKVSIHGSSGSDKKKMTLVSLIKNIIKYLIAIIVVLMILNVYGVDTTSIIASLGIVGVIVGLAFQDIVKDFLAGIFIIFDNQYAVGDYVKINDFTGEVISLGLKTTKIKSYTGEVLVLSNSSFTEVTNYNFSDYRLVLKVPIGYEIPMDKIEKIFEDIKEEISKVDNVKEVTLLGLDSFDSSDIKYAIEVFCNTMTQTGVKRKSLGIIKKYFDDKGIEIPYNKLDVNIRK